MPRSIPSILATALVVLVLFSVVVRADTLVVCNSAVCYNTIQAAIDAASPDDTIFVNEPVHTEGGIRVTKNLTIKGLGPDHTTVQAVEVGEAVRHRVFLVERNVEAVIRDMTISQGYALSQAQALRDGGGILNHGHLTVINAIITMNIGRNGGGIANGSLGTPSRPLSPSATLIIERTRIEDNLSFESGGGVANLRGTVRIRGNSEISNNEALSSGGGISNRMGELYVERSTVSENTVADPDIGGDVEGGGVSSKHGFVEIRESSFTGNKVGVNAVLPETGSGGAIQFFHDESNIVLSTFDGNRARQGGALTVKGGRLSILDSSFHSNIAHEMAHGDKSGAALFSAPGATVDVRRSTFAGNEGKYALANKGNHLGLYNSTVSSNLGGGVVNGEDSSLEVINSTIAFHLQGGGTGIWNSGGTTRVSNSIVAENQKDCQGGIVAVNPNLASSIACGFNISGPAKLDQLASNRGAATQTHALLPGSAAIGAADLQTCLDDPISGEDQTMKGRPSPHFVSYCDLGAYEVDDLQGFAISPTNFNTPPLGGTTFTASGGDGNYSFDLTANNSGGSIDSVTGEYVAGSTGNVDDTVRVSDGTGATATATVTIGPELKIFQTASSTPPLGNVQFTATGGDGDYEFEFLTNNSDGTIGLHSGSYVAGPTGNVVDTIKVTDGLGATATATVDVTSVVNIPTVIATTDQSLCQGDFPAFDRIRFLRGVLVALATAFDEFSNVIQCIMQFNVNAGEGPTWITQTGDVGEFGTFDFFLNLGLVEPGKFFAHVRELLGDGSTIESLGQFIDDLFTAFLWQGLSFNPTVDSLDKVTTNAAFMVVQAHFQIEGAGLVSADLDTSPVALSVLFHAGDPVGDGFVFDAFHPGAVPGIALNPLGDGAVVADVIDTTSGAVVDGLLAFRADTPGAALLLREGEETEFPGMFINRIVNVAMDGDGVIAVLGRVAGTGITSTNDEAVWVCIAALCSIAVQEGMEPDGMPGVRLRFPGSPVVRGGMLLMRTVLEGAGIDSTNNNGILLVDLATGAIRLAAQKGDAFAGSTIADFTSKAFSNDVPLVVVRLASIARALARIDSDGLVPLIAPGDEFTLPDGTVGVVSGVIDITETGGEDGRPSAVGGGGYAIVVNFADGRQGIVACTAACLEGGG